jgi:hypothetical protein
MVAEQVGGRTVIALDALAMLLSAALLFSIQPMVARAVLPALGGSAAVWTTCLAYFQAVLLGGYLYAYASLRWLRPRWQVLVHLALNALAVIPLQAAILGGKQLLPPPEAVPGGPPAAWLLAELARRLGFPLLFVASTAPLVQGWVASRVVRTWRDPYFLYAASNAGSLVALLSYPILIEPFLPLSLQADFWETGLEALAVLVAVCGVVRTWPAVGEGAPEGAGSGHDDLPSRALRRQWLSWAALAFIPSSLLLGLTLFLTTDIAPVPLLWVVPLALYLATYIVAFSTRGERLRPLVARAFPLALMALVPALAVGLVHPFWIPLHLLVFTLASLLCHGELAARRPPAFRLAAFYLALAAGGALGGVFNALAAPVLFDRLIEYRLSLVLAALALPAVADARPIRERIGPGDLVLPLAVFVLLGTALGVSGLSDALTSLAAMLGSGLAVLACWAYRIRPVRFALVVGAVFAACGFWPGRDGRVLLRTRDFYGVLRVTRDDASRTTRLFHGRTLHGEQSMRPGQRREPRAYFARTGPVGRIFEGPNHPRRVAVVGLGCGTLACYARPGDDWTFLELDPAVVRIARDQRYFTYLADCRADRLDVVVGDARHALRHSPAPPYDLIVLDAFSSDSVPVHLLTREAFRLYRARLAPDGRLAFNLSNEYLDLEPVIAALTGDAGWVCRICYDLDLGPEDRRQGRRPTIWAVAARRIEALGSSLASDPRWVPAQTDPRIACWTDEYSNLFRSLSFEGARSRLARHHGEPSRQALALPAGLTR